MAACRSVSVATPTRAANVDALSSWSACRVSTRSRTGATSRDGARPSRARRDRGRGGGGGQLAVPERRCHVLEGDGPGALADLVAPVVELARRAVDLADRRPRRDDVFEPRLPRRLHRRLLVVQLS